MNKLKTVTYLVIFMLVANVVIVSYILFSDSQQFSMKKRPMPREIIIKKLDFDKQQIAQYEILISNHQKKIRAFDDSIRLKKNELYSHLKNDTSKINESNHLITELAKYQSQIETTHFNHFMDIKKICRKEQLKEYNVLTEELSKLFSHPRRPRNDK